VLFEKQLRPTVHELAANQASLAAVRLIEECVCSVLEEQEILDRVTSIDFSKKYSVSYVMDNTCRVELGRVDDLSLKLEIISGILEMKGDLGGMSAVVDVTNLSKPTFRLLGASDTLLSD